MQDHFSSHCKLVYLCPTSKTSVPYTSLWKRFRNLIFRCNLDFALGEKAWTHSGKFLHRCSFLGDLDCWLPSFAGASFAVWSSLQNIFLPSSLRHGSVRQLFWRNAQYSTLGSVPNNGRFLGSLVDSYVVKGKKFQCWHISLTSSFIVAFSWRQ